MLYGTISQNLSGLASELDRKAIQPIVVAGANVDSSLVFNSAGLAASASPNTAVKTGGSTTYYIVDGVLGSIASGTNMAALVGTVVNATFNVFAFFVDRTGTLTSAMGAPGASLGAVTFPGTPLKTACIGFVIINPTGTGNFIGGTTAMADGTVVPNAVYISITGGMDASSLLG